MRLETVAFIIYGCRMNSFYVCMYVYINVSFVDSEFTVGSK